MTAEQLKKNLQTPKGKIDVVRELHVTYINNKDKLIKESIIKKIGSEKISSDSSFTSKALVALREKYEMKITDTTLKNGYDKVYNN